MSLRLRLNLLLGLLNLGFLATLAVLTTSNMRASIQEEITAAHRVTVQLLGTAAQTSSLMGPAPAVMQNFLQRLGRVRANEIRLYGTDGRLRYVSPPSHYKEGRVAPGIFVHLMRAHIDKTLIDLPGARLEIIPDDSRAVLDAWDDLTILFLLWLAFFVTLHLALLWFLRHLLRPAEALLGGLDQLAHGNFSVQLPPSPVAEWDELTSGFNTVAVALQRGQREQRQLALTTQALTENREVTQMIEAGIEAERKRLSRELHDELGQSVTAIRLIATSLARHRDARPELAANAGKIAEIAAGLYDGVQRIVRELRPAVLEQSNLATALEEIAREWRTLHPETGLQLTCTGDCSELGEELTLAAFRAVQESLTNVLKHAAARQVEIAVTHSDEILTLDIRDDGRGAPSQPGTRRGLAGMRERAVALGGTLEAGPVATGGFRVMLSLPIHPKGKNP
ncbi:MAG: histidine kinase [Rugosibacter sp.]|nr:histidine kinase [Rugosibacter sp.]